MNSHIWHTRYPISTARLHDLVKPVVYATTPAGGIVHLVYNNKIYCIHIIKHSLQLIQCYYTNQVLCIDCLNSLELVRRDGGNWGAPVVWNCIMPIGRRYCKNAGIYCNTHKQCILRRLAFPNDVGNIILDML